jgi:hypothetical protein
VRGFTDNLRLAPGEGSTPGFFRELLPALEDESGLPELLTDLDATSRLAPPEMVGAAIATQSRRGGFAMRWRTTFGFRNEGAEWGLVALDQRVARTRLLRDLDVALGRRGLTPIASPASPAALPSGSAPPPSTPPDTSFPTQTSTPRATRPASTPAVTPPPPMLLPQPPPLPTEPAEAIVDTVDDLFNGLLGQNPLP